MNSEARGWSKKASVRLVKEPVIVACAPRSGSTLLRAVLGGHSRLHAPHEIPLAKISAAASPPARLALGDLGGQDELDYLLWDQLAHQLLARSGKATLVHKSPTDVPHWRRLASCWPDARWIFLLRHPGSVLTSWLEATRHGPAASARYLRGCMDAVSDARAALPGWTVRYEQLTADPEAVLQDVCGFLGVDFEPAMLHYGPRHSEWPRGLGDWRDKIRTGAVQPPRPLPAPDLVPELLRPVARDWGYLP
ncbi:sulfotransferase family protein [Nonomuraea sp. NPDC050663]|uniref:sulfotransferase family protein n=1 Tax=Nonomuraea sp. NPDC050663 TaxID=3364370 RepID=UPI0037A40270